VRLPVFRVSDEARSKPFETPGRRRPAVKLVAESAWEEARAKSRATLRSASPMRVKPKGAASAGRTNPAAGARDSRKGKSPGTAARWAGPAQQRGRTDGKNGMWVHPRGNAADTFREEKAPKGEIP
jgi:hypothetical protein